MRTHRMRALAAIAAVFVLIAAACEHDNPAAPTTTTTTPEPTTTTTAPDPEPEDAGPLQLSLTIHVEGRGQAVTNEAAFDIHTGLVEQVADAAEDEGALVSFDLSNDFAVAASRWDSTIATDLEDRGHAIGLHADVGGQGNPTFGALVSELSAMHDNVTALGIDTAHVSGICSEGPWVEAALAAGFTATNGLVEYCYKSLSLANLPADHTDVLDCNSPALCHTPAPDEIDYKVHPWWVSDSSDWLTADADGEMLLMTGVGGAPFACDGGPNDPGSCGAAEVQSGDDFADLIEQYLAARDDDRVASLNMTWSVGSAPDDAKMAEILGAAVPYVDSGEAEWATVPAVAELAELNRIEADPGDGDGGGEATGTAPATYLVIHADPQQADDLGYERLVAFMDELAADSDSGNAHKITILLSAQFADYLGQDASRRTEAAGWIADGHELGFHHHTAGHLYPDGYGVGESSQDPSLCVDFDDCDIESAVALVRDFVESPDIGGTLAAANMGPMDAFGVSYTDDWIDGFQGANVAYADDDKTSGWWQDGDGLLGGLTCLASDTYANIGEPVPAIPHAQYYAETGKAHAVPLDAIEDALDSGTADDFVGIVWHPMGYDSVPAGSVPIGANRIDALLDALDTRGIASATVSETVAGATAAC